MATIERSATTTAAATATAGARALPVTAAPSVATPSAPVRRPADVGRGDPALLDVMVEHLGTVVLVVDGTGTIVASLGPTGGLIGFGDRIGTHIFDFVHPDDLPTWLERSAAVVASAPGSVHRSVARVRHADGSWRTYETVSVNRLADPAVRGVVIRCRPLDPDTVDGGANPAALVAEGNALSDAVPVAIVVLDPNQRVLFANHAASTLLHRSLDQLRHEGLPSALDPVGASDLARTLHHLATTGGRAQLVVDRPPSDARDTPATVSIDLTSRGRAGTVVVMTDVTADVRHRQQLASEASTDSLTGLPNRAAARRELARRLASSPSDVAVAFCDLDGFKAVNDRYGHQRGDQVLVQVGAAIAAAVRHRDMVARLGGDEFVVVLDRASATGTGDHAASGRGDDASDLVGRIATEVTRRLRQWPELPPVTVSVGVAEGRPGDTIDSLLDRADIAMYRHKQVTTRPALRGAGRP